MAYPYTWENISVEENEDRKKRYTNPGCNSHNAIRTTPLDMFLPAKFADYLERIWNFEPKPDDIWIITYPKCGTTLTQELMWQIANGANTESEESKKHIFLRVPFIEMTGLQTSLPPVPNVESDNPMDDIARLMNDTVTWTQNAGSPRIIKTHLPMCMLPPKILDVSKVIYVGRNPKDVCVSFFHFEKLLPVQGLDQSVDFDDYAMNFFMQGKVIYGHYWTHLKDGWKCRDSKNFKFIWYEDLRADLKGSIKELAQFTGYSLNDDQVAKLADYCDIEKFKKNDAVNMKPPKGMVPDEVRENFNFIRKGQVGDWKNFFKNEENLTKWNQWIENNNGGPDKIPIKYEL